MVALNHKIDAFNAQARRVWNVTAHADWMTLEDISIYTGDPVQSVSARLRDFRKEKFGSHNVERRQVTVGLYEYRVIPNTK